MTRKYVMNSSEVYEIRITKRVTNRVIIWVKLKKN